MLNKVKIAWFGKHFGEEPPLIGTKRQGAGGIFFSGCNLRCSYCQNYQISQQSLGKFYDIEDLAEIMIDLQKNKVATIDLVTPTIWYKQIKEAILLAKQNGLTIPIVWNSNAYERIDILQTMKGLIDVYLPDFKYYDDDLAQKYSKVKNYSSVALAAIKEMFAQVGQLMLNEKGLAQKGLIVRHLILPNNLSNSYGVLERLAEFSTAIHVSLMSQYFPLNKANLYKEINRRVNEREVEAVFDKLVELGFENGWIQDMKSAQLLIPDFTKKEPFSCSKN